VEDDESEASAAEEVPAPKKNTSKAKTAVKGKKRGKCGWSCHRTPLTFRQHTHRPSSTTSFLAWTAEPVRAPQLLAPFPDIFLPESATKTAPKPAQSKVVQLVPEPGRILGEDGSEVDDSEEEDIPGDEEEVSDSSPQEQEEDDEDEGSVDLNQEVSTFSWPYNVMTYR
jgi:hypothetical protein